MNIFIGQKDYDQPICDRLGYKFYPCLDEAIDYKIYDFIENLFRENKDIERLVIDSGEDSNNYIGVRIALYIRVAFDFNEKFAIPIIIASDVNENKIKDIIKVQNSHEKITELFDTIHIVDRNFENEGQIFVAEVEKKFAEYSYKGEDIKEAITKLKITSREQGESHHSFTNQWGMWKLAQATGNTAKLLENENFSMMYKTLYFQYLIAKDTEVENATKQTIDGKGAKILLIDDDAEKGWSSVMNEIFTNCLFDHVSTNTENFIEEAKKKIIEFEADVVLLDVRLTSEDSLSSTETNQLSGTQLLEEIKKKNKGIQVIIFTASNKAWNMKALLEAGANGYYIKQSPDSYYGENYATENFTAFQKEIEEAIEKASFLKWFWKYTDELIKHLAVEYLPIGSDFINSVKLSLNYAYDTIENYNSNSTNDQKFLNYAFVAYCNLIEFIVADLSESIPNGSKNYYLKATNTHLQKEIIVNKNLGSGNPVYKTFLEFKEKVTNPLDKNIIVAHPYYELKANLIVQSVKDKFEDRKRLKILAGYAAILLLRYTSFSHQDVQDYEILKEKRHKFMHSNENQSNNISLVDCKDIFKMVYAVLKGEKI